MCWKKLPYWLKGGIIGLIIVIIYNIMELIILGTDNFTNWFLYLLLDIVIIFIIGVVIGHLIYKKKKQKKKVIIKKTSRRKKR